MPEETSTTASEPATGSVLSVGVRWWERVRSSRTPWRRGLLAAGLALFVAASAGTGPEPSVEETAGRANRDSETGVSGPAPSQPATTTTVDEPRRFTLVATGDVLLHSPLWDQAERDAADAGQTGLDFEPLLAGVRPIVEDGDLSLCHLETPLAPAGGPYAGYPSFSVPPDIAPALAATGYDACTTASNHVYDRGADGVDRTLDALDAAGLDHAGSARSRTEAAETTLLDAGDTDAKVALLSYSYGFNGIPAPNGETWRSNQIDEDRILTDASEARAQGADVVVVSLHWGDEYVHEPNSQQETLAPALIRSPDVDLLLGHHAHVVQPVEAIDGEWVVYGMGNMVAYQGTLGATKEEGLLVRFTFTEAGEGEGWEVTDAEFTGLLTVRGASPTRVVDVGEALADPAQAGAPPQRLQEAWDRTNDVVQQRGGDEHGLRPIHEP